MAAMGFEPFQQGAAYAAAASACGARVRWLEFGCGRALAVERGPLRLVSRGPVWEGEPGAAERRRAIRRMARWPGMTLVTAGEEVAGFGLVPLVTPMHHALWDLSGDLRAGLAGKWRNRLVRAEASAKGRRAGRAALERLIAAEAVQRHARGYRALPAAFTLALDPGALRIWDWPGGAAMCFVVHGKSATYHLGWTSPEGRAAGVHGVILMRAAEALAAEGVRWLDLGTVDTEAAPGLARFKLGTGAALKRLGATMLVLP